LDPLVFIHKKENQMNDLLKELEVQREKNERTFITVLTINMAEELTKFLLEKKIKVTYLHNELHTIERTKILNDLRKGKYEALVGINLLKEGIDVPEVSLVAIFDADKPGLFRNETSLIQTFGRAARNKNGRIIMYADDITKDMKHAMEETTRRRNLQEEYNKVHNIIPQTIIKPIRNDLSISLKKDIKEAEAFFHSDGKKFKSVKERIKLIESLKKEMLKASKLKNFERAIELRDLIIELEGDGKIN
jgi:excinuclease ABC subunit B